MTQAPSPGVKPTSSAAGSNPLRWDTFTTCTPCSAECSASSSRLRPSPPCLTRIGGNSGSGDGAVGTPADASAPWATSATGIASSASAWISDSVADADAALPASVAAVEVVAAGTAPDFSLPLFFFFERGYDERTSPPPVLLASAPLERSAFCVLLALDRPSLSPFPGAGGWSLAAAEECNCSGSSGRSVTVTFSRLLEWLSTRVYTPGVC
ncbi:unnamed protein product, partial [Ectocarpus sp. 8 AP-2014]